MVDIEKFKSEFKNMKMQSDLMVKHDDVQKLIDKYLVKISYFLVKHPCGSFLVRKKSNGDIVWSKDVKEAKKIYSLKDAAEYLEAEPSWGKTKRICLVFGGWE